MRQPPMPRTQDRDRSSSSGPHRRRYRLIHLPASRPLDGGGATPDRCPRGAGRLTPGMPSPDRWRARMPFDERGRRVRRGHDHRGVHARPGVRLAHARRWQRGGRGRRAGGQPDRHGGPHLARALRASSSMPTCMPRHSPHRMTPGAASSSSRPRTRPHTPPIGTRDACPVRYGRGDVVSGGGDSRSGTRCGRGPACARRGLPAPVRSGGAAGRADSAGGRQRPGRGGPPARERRTRCRCQRRS